MRYAVATVTLESGIVLSYAAQGDEDGPVLVLLPGPTDSWRSYEPVLGQIPRSIRVVAVSQRGHGDSDKPALGYGVEHFAADVVLLLDGLSIERAVLAGHSGSCMVARRVAIDHPDRIAGLVLEASPTTLCGHAALEDFVATVVAGLEDPIDPGVARSFLTATSTDELAPGLQDRLVGELLKVPARVWKEMFAALLTYDDLAEIGRITAPTLLVWGTTDGLVGRDMQDLLAERIHGAELLTYPGIGHTPRWENPTRFAHDIAEFVARAASPRP